MKVDMSSDKGGHNSGDMKLGWHVMAWGAALAALALVFTAYLSPQFAFDLASRIWACF